MTLQETSIEVVVVPPPTDSPSPEQPHNLACAVEERVLVPTAAKVAENKKECLHMEQDQEDQPSLTIASSTITTAPRPASTLKRMVTSVSFDPLPTSREKGENKHLLSVTPARRRREVSFDISYSAQMVSRSRSDSRAVTCTVDVDEATTTIATTTVAAGDEEEDLTKRPTWVPDREAPSCHQCAKGFTFIRRRHHCRACGGVFCGACSSNRITIPRLDYTSTEVRVCDHCWVREAELRYRKPSVSLFASASLVPASGVRRRPRRQSLSKSSEVAINKNLLKRSLRNMEMAAEAAVAKVQAEQQQQREKKNEDVVDAGHERKENQ